MSPSIHCGPGESSSLHIEPCSPFKRIKQGMQIATCVNFCLFDSTGPVEPEPYLKHELPRHLKSLYDRSIVHLDAQQAAEVYQVLREFLDLFSEGVPDLGTSNLVKHQINTVTYLPATPTGAICHEGEANKAIGEM